MLNTIHTVEIEDLVNAMEIVELEDGIYKISTDKSETVLEVLAVDLALKTITIRHQHSVHDLVFKDNLDLVLDKMGIKRSVETVETDIKAPMPGKVIDIIVTEGDEIAKGDGVMILEAMKMENVLKAEQDCIIKTILIKKGESVEKNEILIELA